MAYERVLALGAHPDDVELGCGGLLSRLRRAGCQIRVHVYSPAEQSLPDSLPPDTLKREFRASMGHLGLGDDALHIGDYPVRRLPEHRQDILEHLVATRRSYQPDLVLTMNSKDSHQDHEVIHRESVRAFRGVTILGYEIPWNQQQNIVNLFAEVTEEDLAMKAAMLAEYTSQSDLGRPYIRAEYTQSAAAFHGFQARRLRAEAFEVLTMMWDL
jgi:LmbE family N-acetylglucosaminyl deacetylase